ncbi:MAG: YHS domain-containing (seleno)protein [Pseudomonadota bacterium]
MLSRRTLLTGSAAALLAPHAAVAADKSEIYMDLQGRALKGYDSVAYHVQRKPMKGNPALSMEWKGAKWLFSTPANLVRFRSEPERWAPQYGGYCAWAVAKGWARPINPTIFRIFDDKLYLNLNMEIHRRWLKKRHTFIAEANEQWPGILVQG